jgi:D-sedoheptulose 7-phosphate isomerase/D-glycero-D-manno-heptose 1,7-bisphosphate phosphatase
MQETSFSSQPRLYFKILQDKIEKLISTPELENIVELFHRCLAKSNNVAVIGNGGSQALSDHAICDFEKSRHLASIKINPYLNFVSLGSSPSLVSALNNDIGHEFAFEWLVRAKLRQDDLLIAISSSGRSLNIKRAIEAAEQMKVNIICLTGFGNNDWFSNKHLGVCVQSNNYGHIEDIHGSVLHALAQSIL